MSYSVIGIVAFVVHWIMHRGFYKKPAFTDVAREFKRYLTVVTFYYVFDAAWGFINDYKIASLLYVDTLMYYLTMGLSVVFCCRYVIAFLSLGNGWGRLINTAGVGFFVMEIVSLIVNLFYPVMFWIDDDAVYHAAIMRHIVHYFQILMFASISLLSFLAWRYKSEVKRERYRTICLFALVMALALILQTVFPLQPMYSLGVMVGTLIIHVFLHEDELSTQFAMLDGLIRDYHTIIAVAKDDMRLQLVRSTNVARKKKSEQIAVEYADYDVACDKYINKYVAETDRRRIAQEVDSKTVLARLEREDFFVINYLRTSENGELEYYQMAFSNVELAEGKTQFVVGFRNVDGVIREERVIKQQLEDARRAAEAANQAKTSFLFNMSHDIRTPMNAIMGFRNLLEKYQDDSERRADYLAKIEDSSNVLLSIINNVLEMARIERGTIEVVEQPGDIRLSAGGIGSLFKEMMEQKGLRFTYNVYAEHNFVYFDHAKVREVFINLVSNAYKYTNAGGTVDISLYEEPCDRPGYVYFRIVISDNGIGMSEEFLPHIFEEFSREHNSSCNRIEGTGLGMPIVKRLVELMGGTIDVSSRLGEGTSVTVVLPHRIAEAQGPQEELVAEPEPHTFKGRRILLAEDNDLNAEIAMELLQEMDLLCERAADGAEVLAMIDNNEPGYYSLVLMDIQMPVMSGYEAAVAIRALGDDLKSQIPILA